MEAALDPRLGIGGNNPPTTEQLLAEKHRDLLDRCEAAALRANGVPKVIDDDADLTGIGEVVRDARRLMNDIKNTRLEETQPHRTAVAEINRYFDTVSERLDRVAKVLAQRCDEWARAKERRERERREAEARAAREEEERRLEAARKAEAANRKVQAEKHETAAAQASERADYFEQQAAAPTAELTRARSAAVTVSGTQQWTFDIMNMKHVDLDALRPYLTRDDIEKAIRAFVKVNKDSLPLAGVRIYAKTVAKYR